MNPSVNFLPLRDGSMKLICPQKNAVIVQLIKGPAGYIQCVSIECLDADILPELEALANRIVY